MLYAQWKGVDRNFLPHDQWPSEKKVGNSFDDADMMVNQTSTLQPGIAIFLSALNFVFSISAFVGNTLILVALYKVPSIHPPTKLLFRCLSVTDLCVGLFLQPLFATRILNSATKIISPGNLFYFIEANASLSFILCGVSVLTSTAINLDRLLALILGLRYRIIVTLKRVAVLVTCFWLIGLLFGMMGSFVSFRIALNGAIIWAILSLVASTFSYVKIFLKLRQHQGRVQDRLQQVQQNEGLPRPLNMQRYKRTVSSIAWIQMTMVACYVPFIVATVLNRDTRDNYIAWNVSVTLLYLNSSLNPLVYCWKMKEIKQAVKNTVTQSCCLQSNLVNTDTEGATESVRIFNGVSAISGLNLEKM